MKRAGDRRGERMARMISGAFSKCDRARRLLRSLLVTMSELLPSAPRRMWMQIGVINEAAATKAGAAGLRVVMDRCLKIDHAQLLGGSLRRPL